MTTIATCGHEATELFECAVKSWSRTGYPAVAYVAYCENCYVKALYDRDVLESEEAEQKWMEGY